MANEEHVRIIKKGVRAWHEWRDNNNDVEPDLHGANLSGAHLQGIELNDANLVKANLAYADLTESDLSRANLAGANLSHASVLSAILIGTNFNFANLKQAKLNSSNLASANLTDAVLDSADLYGVSLLRAHLDGASLNETNLSNAVLGSTILTRLDLSTVRGLEATRHHGPSSIGIDTLYLSQGHIPETFLRGAGVPDGLITYAASLTKQPIQFYSCFISYSSKDDPFARVLYADLQNESVRCWFAPEDLKIGDKTRIQIDESIRVYDKLLLILSEESIASDWVEKEVETALELERQQKRTVLVPVRLDDEVMNVRSGWAADIRRSRHIGDFTRWKVPTVYKQIFARLLRDLNARNTMGGL